MNKDKILDILQIISILAIAVLIGLAIAFYAPIVKEAIADTKEETSLDVVEPLSIDGIRAEIPGYKIDGTNYYHLRALAIAVANTPGRFDIRDVGDDYIRIESGYNYTGEIKRYYASTIKPPDICSNERNIYVNDCEIEVLSCVIDGETYINLRSLSEHLGYDISYAAGVVSIDTSHSICSYIRDEIYDPKFTYDPFTNVGLRLEDINKILAHSSIPTYGEYFYELQNTYGINIIYAISVAYVESGRGRYPCGSYNYFGMLGCNYASPRAGINAFGELMHKKLYYGKSIDQIAPIYCDRQWAGLVKSMMHDVWKYI